MIFFADVSSSSCSHYHPPVTGAGTAAATDSCGVGSLSCGAAGAMQSAGGVDGVDYTSTTAAAGPGVAATPGGGGPGDPMMGSNPGDPGVPNMQPKPPGQSMMDKKPVRRIGAKPPPDRAPRSIYCFSIKNPFRKKCLQFVEWKPFEFLILLTILGNCVALAVYTPFPSEDTNEMNLILVSTITYLKMIISPSQPLIIKAG